MTIGDTVMPVDNPTSTPLFRRMVRPLRSRKVRVALVTLLATVAAEMGLDVSPEALLAITGLGASLILGIAHEDAGRNAAPRLTPPARNESRAV